MKQGVLLSLMLFGLQAQAAEEKVYLLATAGLNDSNLAQSIFLHEADITSLDACREAVRQGQRDGDWLKYHHILRRDKMQGFSVQMQYRCVTGTQDIQPWFDRARYEHPYLISVDEQSSMTVRRMDTMAACMGAYRALPAARQAISHCAKSNQKVL